MDREYRKDERDASIGFLVEKLKKDDRLEYLGLDRSILKWTLQE
jgi:hypothetical protein